jgi:hypothetical protein
MRFGCNARKKQKSKNKKGGERCEVVERISGAVGVSDQCIPVLVVPRNLELAVLLDRADGGRKLADQELLKG